MKTPAELQQALDRLDAACSAKTIGVLHCPCDICESIRDEWAMDGAADELDRDDEDQPEEDDRNGDE